MALTAAEVFRDFVTDGVPPSGPNKPKKSEIRTLLKQYEQIINAFTSTGGVIYASKAEMDADLSKAANTLAWVIGDATSANNGIYGKVGGTGTGSWVRRADLPYSFIVATDEGAGTPNAIQASTPIAVSESALIILNVFEDNTAAPVTVSFNGGDPLTVKTNTGNDVAAGGLAAGMRLFGVISGSTFRLVSDQVSSSIVAAAEAAVAEIKTLILGKFIDDAAATAAAGTPVPGQLYWNLTSSVFRYWDGDSWETIPYATIADGTVTVDKLSSVMVPSYTTVAALQTLSIRAATKVVTVAGYATEGDGGAAQWKRVASAPAHGAGVRTVDRFLPNGTIDASNGGWWDVDEAHPNERMFGAVTSRTNAQRTAAIQSLLNFAGAGGKYCELVGRHTTTATLNVPAGVTVNFPDRGDFVAPLSSSVAVLTKGFNGDMLTLATNVTLNNPSLNGNGATFNGRGIVISAGTDQNINYPMIWGMASYCLEFTTGGEGVRFQMKDGVVVSNSGFAIRMPASEATTTGVRRFTGIVTGGTPFIDIRNGNLTEIINCNFTEIGYGSTTTGRTIVIGNRIATTGILVFGTEHQFSLNALGGPLTIGSGATNCKFVGNIIAGGGTVTNSSGNSTNQIV